MKNLFIRCRDGVHCSSEMGSSSALDISNTGILHSRNDSNAIRSHNISMQYLHREKCYMYSITYTILKSTGMVNAHRILQVCSRQFLNMNILH